MRTWMVCLLTGAGLLTLGISATNVIANDYQFLYRGSWNMAAGVGSDVWGWTAPDGTEYALFGYRNGIAVIQTTGSIGLRDTIPGPVGNGGFIWRDIKTYQNYCYSVSEATGSYSGITVADLSFLPDSVHVIGSFSTNGASGRTSHNINIDEATGFAYVEGNSSTQQIRILDLSNPELPTYVSSFGTSTSSIHDIYAHNDTVWVAEGSSGRWSIWDLTNKMSPQLIVRVSIPNSGYAHNIWPSPDRNYLVTTEETVGKTIKIWDVSDLGNISIISEFLAPNGMAHNAHWTNNNLLVNSHYESGVQLVNVADPANPVIEDLQDLYPADDEGGHFNGTWGAFPFTQNNYVYASNRDGKVWFFEVVSLCPLADVPVQTEPSNGATAFNNGEFLRWTDVGADSVHIQCDDDAAFGSPEVDAAFDALELQLTGLEFTTTYYWRVSSLNSCGESNWSPTQSFTTGCIVVKTGDVNESGSITSSDVIDLVNYVFKSGTAPAPIEAAGDVDCSGTVSSEDIIFLVNFTFKSGPTPCDVCTLL